MIGFFSEVAQGSCKETMEVVFRSVIDFLRTSHDREQALESEVSATAPREAVMGDKKCLALQNRIFSIECPSLSLRHLGHLNIGQNSRIQAEQESAALLARPITVQVTPNSVTGSSSAENGTLGIAELPNALMNNMYESFAILVDSRLRVYSKIFFRHLTSLVSKQADAFGILQMGQKLETLHDIGGQIKALSMQVHAHVDGNDEPEEVSNGVYRQRFKLEATMELHVPSPTGQSRTLVVRNHGEGCLKGAVREEDKKLQVTIEVNTKGLLNSMMDQASLMVAQIVETTNEAFSISEPKLERGASFFVMPPPKPRKKPSVAGLDLLSEAARVKDTVVITPDLGSKTSDSNLVPALQLHPNEDNDDIGEDPHVDDDLSVDQCASIIDDVFGCMDDALLQGPPRKKSKTFK